MPKFLYIAGGVVAGALGGALVVLLIAFVAFPGVYDPGPEVIFDFITPIFILAAMALAALLGGAFGAVAGINAAEGRMRRAAIVFGRAMGTVGILTLLAVGGLWAMVHMP